MSTYPPDPSTRLLLVDDVRLNRALLAARLTKLGYQVGECADGPEALAVLDAQAFDLVLLDIEMPQMSGFEVVRAIRAGRRQLELPVIMLTGRDDSDAVIEALAAGANDYVLKRDDIRVVVARIEAQLQLRRAMAELQQARRLEAVGQLAGGMAHEINTPLQYIGDNAAFVNDAVVELLELLEQYAQASGELPSTARDALTEQLDRLAPFHRQLPQAVEEITRGVERVAEVINALRTFATPTGGQQANTDLPELLRTAVTVSRNVWQVVADLQLELDPAARDVVCDRQQLGQVIAGLLVNAAQAHEAQRQGNADAPRGHITLRTRRDDHDICIEVADDGPGIPPGLEQRIFDPFFTTQPVGKATGQGLALCEAVMRQHGGTVSVQSALGQGATFTLRLPQR